MKLMVCIMNNYYVNFVEKQLRREGFRMTELSSSGGFLKKGNTTFLFGVEEKDVAQLQQALKEACLQLEKVKGRRRGTESRYTSFVIDAAHAAPFMT